MEALEYFHGGYFRAGTPQQATPEKKAASGGGACGGDNFAVEDLLDFSNEEEEDDDSGGMLAPGDDGAFDGAAGGSSTDSSTVTAVDSCSNSFSGGEQHFPPDLICQSFPDASLSADICEPQYGDLAELEWLSNFVDESSFPSEDLHKLHLISGINSTTTTTTTTTTPTTTSSSSSCASPTAAAGVRGEVSAIARPVERAPQPPIFRPEGPVPGKARSKRSRAAPCNWSSRLLLLSPSRTATSSPESELIVPPSSAIAIKKPAKPAKKKEMSAGPGVALGASEGRKCLHCQTDKTPQWRTGPMGPKTLCNACGVRYKSGRLVPEYRPAASPTFVLSKHSNSHRKVLELRRQKELQQQQHILSPAGGVGAMFDGISPMAAAGEDFLIHHRLGPDFRQLI